MNDKSNLNGVWFTVAIMLLFVAQIFLFREPSETIAYSDFHRLLVARQVDNLEIGPAEITGSVRMPGAAPLLPASAAKDLTAAGAPWRFTTLRVTDNHLIDDLADAGVRYTGVADSTWLFTLLGWLVPVFVLVDQRVQLDRIAKRLLECEVRDQQTLLKLIAGDDEAPAPDTPQLEVAANEQSRAHCGAQEGIFAWRVI